MGKLAAYTVSTEFSSIDVVIPVYNGQDFIITAIESVAAQTLLPDHIFVIDDGSTDRTAELIEKYILDNPESRVCYIAKTNGGLSSARNVGINASSSPYLAFLDADDVWLTHKLESQIAIFNQSEDDQLGVVYCGYTNMDMDGRALSDFPCFQIEESARGNIFETLLFANKVAASGSGVLVKRACFDKVGVFDENLPTCEDWDMWLRIAKEYHFEYVDDLLVSLRRHTGSMQRNRHTMHVGTVMVLNKWTKEAGRRPEVLRYWRNQYAVEIIFDILRELPNQNLLATLKPIASKELILLLQNNQAVIGGALIYAGVRTGYRGIKRPFFTR